MKILLINPPGELEHLLGIGKEFVQKYEPLGLLYIAAVIKEQGIHVSVIDAHAEDLDIEALKVRILNNGADIIGISTLTCNGAIVYALGKWIKKHLPATLVVLGNIHASVFAKHYLENACCDIVVHGEGEYVILKIIQFYEKKIGLKDIPAISFLRKDGTYIKISEAAYIPDLTKLPFPARELVNHTFYHLTAISNQSYVGESGAVAKTMSTSRGCPNYCTFCVVKNDRKQRFNNAKRVVDEMEMLEKMYHVAYITIMDPLFMGNEERIYAICSEIKKRKLKIKWGCDAHIRYITEGLVTAMESAGCYALDFGIESGVQRLLNNVKKGITIREIRKAIEMTKKNSKIHIAGLFILGLPGETYADSLETIRFAKSLPLDMAQFSILTPYPGSPLFNELSQKGELDTGMRGGGRVDTSVWKRYSAYISFTDNDPIWVTPELSCSQIKQLQKRAQREFYLRPSQIMRHLCRIKINNFFKILKIVIKGFI
ncbi:MAG: B12-binding domain-containing radical SAM protein [Candidatus Omnitrophica bacterium]|nr:B12-binding domain-containing radical SAM protein [Candidatus Omnitrophota bacterium]